MTSNNDANDAYTQGVIDTVTLINENEEMSLSAEDVISALAIKAIIERIGG